jgi:sugar lactone lactonase YvrE
MKFEFVDKDFNMKLADVGGVGVDSKDNIYVTPRGGMTPVVIFDRDANIVGTIATGLGVKNPHGICVDPDDNVILVDVERQVVHKFNPKGELLFTLGKLDTPSLESGAINADYKTIRRPGPPFYNPSKAATDKDGDIFIADGYGNCCVHHFSKDGKLLKSWGEPGHGPGKFYCVHGVGVDQENGDIYVADRENKAVHIFDHDGKLKDYWINIWRPTDVYIRGDYVYVSDMGEVLYTDNIFYDPRYHRHPSMVQIFDKKGKQICQIGTDDCGEPGSFMGAHGICVDSHGDIIVAEVTNWERHGAYAAWPHGQGMPTNFHPAVQRFKRVG